MLKVNNEVIFVKHQEGEMHIHILSTSMGIKLPCEKDDFHE